MADMVKFSSKLRPETLEQARQHAADAGRTLASVLDEAVAEYLARKRVRPAFREAAEQVMNRHAELLERLAR